MGDTSVAGRQPKLSASPEGSRWSIATVDHECEQRSGHAG